MSTLAEIPGSIPEINAYARVSIGESVEVALHPDKGRVLISKQQVKAGELILKERPLRSVQVDETNLVYKAIQESTEDRRFEPIWYWCVLNSLILDGLEIKHPILKDAVPSLRLRTISAAEQKRLMTLFIPDLGGSAEETEQLAIQVRNLILPRAIYEAIDNKETLSPSVQQLVDEFNSIFDQERMERLLQVWVHNCFEHTDEPLGYVTYFISAFCSHSCVPNGIWTFDEKGSSGSPKDVAAPSNTSDLFCLRARLDIKKGDEISISYLSESALYEPTPMRQFTLTTTKGFTCTCPRCTAPADLGRGVGCPKCKTGVLFLHPDDGTDGELESLDGLTPGLPNDLRNIQDITEGPLLASYCLREEELSEYLNNVACRTCLACGYVLDDRSTLCQYVQLEKRLLALGKQINDTYDVDSWEAQQGDQTVNTLARKPLNEIGQSLMDWDSNTPDDEASLSNLNEDWNEIVTLLRRFFPIHWLHILWFEAEEPLLGRSHEYEMILEKCRKQLIILTGILPAHTGAIAWGIDDLVSRWLHRHNLNFKSIQTSELTDDLGMLVKNQLVDLMDHALKSLVLLFGGEHPYATDVACRRAVLVDALERWLRQKEQSGDIAVAMKQKP